MEALLLPTDFSATAKNAAVYALQLAAQLQVKKIVLYHSYEIPVSIDPLLPGIQMLDLETRKDDSEKALADFAQEIRTLGDQIVIDTLNEYGALTAGLDDVCEKVGAGLVVMGIMGGGILEEKLIGSNAISVAKHTRRPVIIVPPGATFTKIEEIMLTGDFDINDQAVPTGQLTTLLRETGARLFVFAHEPGTDRDEKKLSEMLDGNEAMHALLRDYPPEYHVSRNKNFIESINDFALEYQIDLIITLHKKHGFFENLFSPGHTKTLAFHSHVPLMIVHG